MKKGKRMAVIAGMATAVLANCVVGVYASEEEMSEALNFEEGYKVGLAVTTVEYPFYVSMVEGFEKSCQAFGIEYVVSDAGMDAAKQVSDCEDMMSQGVDALIISTWYPDAMSGVIQDMADAGIPVILLDASDPPEVDYLTNIGSDNYESGYLAGLWTGSYIADKDGKEEINYIELVQPSAEGRNRADGFNEGLEDSGLTVNLLNSCDASSREVSMANAEDALVAFDNIDLMFGACAQGSLGANDACTAAQRTEIKIVGYDCEVEEQEYIDQGENYIASVKQYPALMVEEALNTLDAYLGGAEVEKRIPFDNGLYTCEGELTFDEIRENYGG